MKHGSTYISRSGIALVCGVLIGAALAPSAAFGQEIQEFYTGARQLGMGGAYTAVVNDETAVLLNPAGLGKLRDVFVTIADPELHGSFTDTEIAKLDNATKVFSVQGLLDTLKESKGKHWHGKIQAFPSLVGPNVGFGLHGKYSYDAEVSEDGTVYRLDYVNDYAFALGYCFRFFSGIVKLGTTVRLVNRVEVHENLDATATNLELGTIASEGMGVGTDVGLIVTAPVAYLPAIAAVLRDAGGTSYTLTDGMFYSTTSRPDPTPQKLDVGLSIQPILSNQVRATFTVDYHDALGAGGPTETDVMRRLHAGVEMNFHDFFFLRGGMNQRYWTAGLELATERFQFQAASYGEDIGQVGTPREDRRWVGKFSTRF